MKTPGKLGPFSRSPNKTREPGSLKEATALLVDACGGYDEAAKRVRVSSSQLQRYSDPTAADAYIPADVVRALELAAADPIVTRFLAAEQGCHLSCVKYDPSPEVLADDMGALAQDVARLTADVAKALARGAGSGAIPGGIAGKLTADIDRTLAVLFHMRGRLKREAE
jgi:hypothetical protein